MIGLHEHDSASVSEPLAARSGLAAQKKLNFLRENILAEEFCKADDCLLHGPNALNDLVALLKEIAQLKLGRVDHLMYARIVSLPAGGVGRTFDKTLWQRHNCLRGATLQSRHCRKTARDSIGCLCLENWTFADLKNRASSGQTGG
jgi:hypothetical protein